jgi:hypothetical protein
VSPVPYLSLVPLGWYRVDFQTLVAGTEEGETIRQLVLVFEGEAEAYRRLIDRLISENLEPFVEEDVTVEDCSVRLMEWHEEFFGAETDLAVEQRLTDLFHVTRHIAQNGKAPTFFRFEERQHHDLDLVARDFIKRDLGPRAIDAALQQEYNRDDRYWRTIYYDYGLFKSQYDACVNRALGVGTPTTRGVIGAPERVRAPEPSDDLKRQVKERDGYRCLCCGETLRRILEVDHVLSRYFGGQNILHNLQTLCVKCNTDKGTQHISFLSHRTLLNTPASGLPQLRTPGTTKAGSREEWEQCLRRAINFFYACAAVASVRIGGRGDGFYHWRIDLYDGNDLRWLKPHLRKLLKTIRTVREAAGFGVPDQITVGAPNSQQISVAATSSGRPT